MTDAATTDWALADYTVSQIEKLVSLNNILERRVQLLEERCAGLSARLGLIEVVQTAYQRAPKGDSE